MIADIVNVAFYSFGIDEVKYLSDIEIDDKNSLMHQVYCSLSSVNSSEWEKIEKSLSNAENHLYRTGHTYNKMKLYLYSCFRDAVIGWCCDAHQRKTLKNELILHTSNKKKYY